MTELEDKGRLETLGKITAGVVHDFNNILSAISGLAELIVYDLEQVPGFAHSKSATEYARHILKAGEIGQATIKDLQALARPGKGQKEEIELNGLLSKAIALISGSMKSNISIIKELHAHDAKIRGFVGPLQNAIFNLLLNARDAMPTGGKIMVRTSNEDCKDLAFGKMEKFLLISVQDTGTGIPQEILKNIFEPFFTTKGKHGNGMGLANVLSTVEAHAGTISVHSRVNIGTEFCIRIPIVQIEYN